MNTHTGTRAFTLIELLVVVAIIAILSGIIYANIGSSREKARDATRISDVSQIQLALSLYYDRCDQYPSTLSVSASNGCPTGVTLQNFIAQIPTPPAGAGQSSYDYSVFTVSGVPANYLIHAKLETANVAVQKGISYTSISQSGGTWSPAINTTPYTACSNASASLDYCSTSD